MLYVGDAKSNWCHLANNNYKSKGVKSWLCRACRPTLCILYLGVVPKAVLTSSGVHRRFGVGVRWSRASSLGGHPKTQFSKKKCRYMLKNAEKCETKRL